MKRLRSVELVTALVSEAVLAVAGELVAQLGGDAPDPGPRAVPRDLRLSLARLRLLDGVPFGQLVADAALLPPESMRFFHLDRGWTDALIEGALSVGTVTSADRSALEGLYGTVRAEVDEAERLVRLPGREPGAPVPAGPAGPITGFLLRSRMVSGWPGLHVRAYARDNLALPTPIADGAVGDDPAHAAALGQLGLLRLERLAAGVLLALFDGVPAVVHVEEPRAGVQFGVDETDGPDGSTTARVRLRNLATSEPFPDGRTQDLRFRPDAPGVVHVAATAQQMVPKLRPPGDARPLDAAEFAMQMLQFPFRAVFGDRTLSGGAASSPGAVFRPSLGLELSGLATRFGGG